jgi:DNA mismatch endonuclease (patch repair protein)
MPASNFDYWSAKIQRNRRRDKASTQALRTGGWHVVRVWEHSLRDPARVCRRIRTALNRTMRVAKND